MRILVVHSAYRQRGGEDAVVDAEATLLQTHGHDVLKFIRNNDLAMSMPRHTLVRETFWSSHTRGLLAKAAREFQPDIVHVHNTFPLVSPSIYGAIQAMGIPVVQTLHNFRLLCPQGSFLREGVICEDCLGRMPWRGAVRGCYRESVAASMVLASMLQFHRVIGSHKHNVAHYIVPSEFSRAKFIEAGFSADKISVKPHSVVSTPLPAGRRSGFLFVGRLSHEKGLGLLVEAARNLPRHTVRVAGDGPERSICNDAPELYRLGEISVHEVRYEMASSMCLVVPSLCYETFGLVVVEAFSMGLPVIAARIGALAELVEDGRTGLLFEPGSAEDLRCKLDWAMNNPSKMSKMGRCAREAYEIKFTPEIGYRNLIRIYERVCSDRP